jgi:hypothetical protein
VKATELRRGDTVTIPGDGERLTLTLLTSPAEVHSNPAMLWVHGWDQARVRRVAVVSREMDVPDIPRRVPVARPGVA